MTAHYTARRLPVLQGGAAWNAILPERFEAPPLAGTETCDVAIIGAGFAGLAAARRLRQGDPGLKISILDALPVGEGGIGRNTGFMIDLPHNLTSDNYAGHGEREDRILTRLNRQAIEFVGKAVDEFGIDPAFFRRSGKINGAVSPKGDAANRSYARHLRELGEPYELIEAEEMRRITGSPLYCCGLHTPGTVLLQPAGYGVGMARGLTRQNAVRIHPSSAVTGFAKRRGGWTVTTAGGRIETGRIILATNGHLESFGFERGRLLHLFLSAMMTAPLDAEAEARLGGEPFWGITPADPTGTTMRRIVDGAGRTRIVTRAGISFHQNMSISPGEFRRAERLMRRKFAVRFPQLADYPVDRSWAGHLCLSRNDASVVRELDDGVVAACVQNGLGTTRGTLTGIAAAERVLGVTSDISGYFSKGRRPSRLFPEPVTTIGARSLIRYKEWQSGLE